MKKPSKEIIDAFKICAPFLLQLNEEEDIIDFFLQIAKQEPIEKNPGAIAMRALCNERFQGVPRALQEFHSTRLKWLSDTVINFQKPELLSPVIGAYIAWDTLDISEKKSLSQPIAKLFADSYKIPLPQYVELPPKHPRAAAEFYFSRRGNLVGKMRYSDDAVSNFRDFIEYIAHEVLGHGSENLLAMLSSSENFEKLSKALKKNYEPLNPKTPLGKCALMLAFNSPSLKNGYYFNLPKDKNLPANPYYNQLNERTAYWVQKSIFDYFTFSIEKIALSTKGFFADADEASLDFQKGVFLHVKTCLKNLFTPLSKDKKINKIFIPEISALKKDIEKLCDENIKHLQAGKSYAILQKTDEFLSYFQRNGKLGINFSSNPDGFSYYFMHSRALRDALEDVSIIIASFKFIKYMSDSLPTPKLEANDNNPANSDNLKLNTIENLRQIRQPYPF